MDYSNLVLEEIVFDEVQSFQFVSDLEMKKDVAINSLLSHDQILKIIDFVTGRTEKYINKIKNCLLTQSQSQSQSEKIEINEFINKDKNSQHSTINTSLRNDLRLDILSDQLIINYESNPANDPTYGFNAGNYPSSKDAFIVTYIKSGLAQFSSWVLTTVCDFIILIIFFSLLFCACRY